MPVERFYPSELGEHAGWMANPYALDPHDGNCAYRGLLAGGSAHIDFNTHLEDGVDYLLLSDLGSRIRDLIDAGATINDIKLGCHSCRNSSDSLAAITVYLQHGIGTWGISCMVNGADCAACDDYQATIGTPLDASELRDEDFHLRVQADNGTSGLLTFRVDCVWIEIDYTNPETESDLGCLLGDL